MIYKYYSNINTYALQNLKNGYICFSHVDQFNDGLEFNVQFPANLKITEMYDQTKFLENELIEQQKFQVRVCCFCESSDLDNMWAYYANNEEGFCVEYVETELRDRGIIIDAVYYSDDIPNIGEGRKWKNNNEINDETGSFLNQVFHKKTCWKEEKEIRAVIILPKNCIYKRPLQFHPLDIDCNAISMKTENVESLMLPIPHNLTETNESYEYISPKNILIPATPKKIILGNRCKLENEFKTHLLNCPIEQRNNSH